MKYLLIIFMSVVSVQAARAQPDVPGILFFGDSITAGYGIEEGQAFPALVQQKIDSVGWDFNVQNGGLSGETSAGGLRRVDWMLQKKVDIFILELGGNDGLRGIDLTTTRENLQQIIDKVKNKYPNAVIILSGMQVPPNLGKDYTDQFKNMFPALAKRNELVLIPFLLKNVGGHPGRMQADGIHPNTQGHKIIAETVWETLKPVLKEYQL